MYFRSSAWRTYLTLQNITSFKQQNVCFLLNFSFDSFNFQYVLPWFDLQKAYDESWVFSAYHKGSRNLVVFPKKSCIA